MTPPDDPMRMDRPRKAGAAATRDVPPLWVCPPRGRDRITAISQQLDRWTSSPALSELVALFGERLPADAELGERLDWLEAFSERWNFRRKARERAGLLAGASQDSGGGARWEIVDSGLDDEQEVRVVELARELGLVTAVAPTRSEVSLLLILGGARLSNLLRPKYAAQLIAKAMIRPRHIVLLGGSRPISDTERDATDSYAPRARTEFDLLTTAASDVFGFELGARDDESHQSPSNANASWQVWRFRADSTAVGLPVTAIEAPSSEPRARRATTADSYSFLANHVNVRGEDCLLVTSQIYVPYQHLEGVGSLALPFDSELETIGFPPGRQSELQGMQAAANYLQETRSAIVSANRLYRDRIGLAGSA